MSRLLKMLRSKRQNGRLVVIPHLYFTYLFMGFVSSVVYRLLGADVLVSLFSWYYLNGIDTFLLTIAVVEFVARVRLINKKEIQ
tara:strand:+ start:11925 stop:12176 length:252 start_codon:yes stop_codon:yes gene_type:complete